MAFSLGAGLLSGFRMSLNRLASASFLLSLTKTEKPLSYVMRAKKLSYLNAPETIRCVSYYRITILCSPIPILISMI